LRLPKPKRASRLELRFALNAPEGASDAAKTGAVARAVFDGELPKGYSWKSENPIEVWNPDTKHGKYATPQRESLAKAGPTLRRVLRKAYESAIGRKLNAAEIVAVAKAAPSGPKIPAKRRKASAKKGHRARVRRERSLSKRQQKALHQKRSRAAMHGWATRRKNKKRGKRGRK
jgi:hypothetical protein